MSTTRGDHPPPSQAEFEAVVSELVEPVRRFLHRRTDPETAQDVLGETLLVCWRRFADMPRGEEAAPWTFGVARLALANAERSRRRRRLLELRLFRERDAAAPAPGPEQSVVEADRIARAMAQLRPAEAEVLRLWAWEDLAPGQIAVVLGITANAASIKLHRAKKKLGDVLGATAARPQDSQASQDSQDRQDRRSS